MQPRRSLLRSSLACAALAALLAARAAAQEREPHVVHPSEPRQEPEPAPLIVLPERALEFAISGDGLWLEYQSSLRRANGYASIGLFGNEDDDYALDGRLMRFGMPSRQTPLGLGIGLGLFGASVEEPDSEVVAVTLVGAAEYALRLDYPVRIGAELAFAPDVSTFSDGEEVLDLLARVELDLSTWATAFAGYRQLELDLDDGGEHELDSSFQAGVRLGF